MSFCSICGEEGHNPSLCMELWSDILELRAPKPSGPRGQGDEDDSLCVSAHEPSADAFLCHQSRQAADITIHLSGVTEVATRASSGDLTRK